MDAELDPVGETDFLSKNMDVAKNFSFINKMGYLQKMKMNAGH